MNFKGEIQMTMVRELNLNVNQLMLNIDSTYTEFYLEFGEAVEEDVDTFEGINFPAEPVLVEDIVTSASGSRMCTEFLEMFATDEVLEIIGEIDTEESIQLADEVMDELTELVRALPEYQEWLEGHLGVDCYVSYWDGGIGLLMDVSL